jgi:hypothetical protein
LPRLRREDLLRHFPAGALDEGARLDLDVLAVAAAAAFALPDLRGRCVASARARRAAIHAAGPEVPSARLAECLEIRPRAVQIGRSSSSEPAAVRAVRMQAALRSVGTLVEDSALAPPSSSRG